MGEVFELAVDIDETPVLIKLERVRRSRLGLVPKP